MPSSRPLPARRIEAKTSFLPSRIGASIVCSGVSMRLHRQFEVAGDLVAEQRRDLAQQPAEAAVEVSFLRMMVSLCCTSG